MKVFLTTFLFLLVVITSFSTYVLTLAPTITAGDSSEMITAAATLGIPHQSSYPINTILGHFFTKLPWGSLPWRVNLMSAVFHALTLGILYLAILEIFKIFDNKAETEPTEKLIAFSSSLFLGFSRSFWINSLKAEVFPLNSLFGSILLLLILRWANSIQHQRIEGRKTEDSKQKTENQTSEDTKYILPFAFILGLGVAHHQTIILILPACLYLIWKNRKELVIAFARQLGKVFLPETYVSGVSEEKEEGRRLTVGVKIVLLFLLGLSSYLSIIFLARRDPSLNWGHPSNLSGALRSFLRADVGGFLAPAISDVPSKETPVSQINYYFRNLLVDFNYWGIVLAILGLFFLWQKRREIFYFLILGISFSGPIFLAFANFPLSGDFSQATVLRFLILSELFWGISLAFGFKFIWEMVKFYTQNLRERTNLSARMIVSLGMSLVFLFPSVSHFELVDQRQNTFAYDFGKTIISSTEDDAIILLSGDIPNFTVDYLRYVEGMGGNRIIFTPGQLHMRWVVQQLSKRYPELIIPPPFPGYRFTITHQVIEANLDKKRPIYISPELSQLDPVVGQNYILWPKGLLFRVYKDESEVKVDDYISQGESFWQTISPKKLSWLTRYHPSLDNPIFFYYPRHFYNLGAMFESEKKYEEAIKQYERTLELDPGFTLAYKAMGVIYGYKMENKNKEKALDYLYKYFPFSRGQEEMEAVREAILELDAQLATESGQIQEATESAEIEEATESGRIED